MFLLAGLCGQAVSVYGQAGSAVLFSTPEVNQFPTIRFTVDVLDAEGQFIDDLQPEDMQVIEDGQALAPQAVTMVNNGLQIIIALNTSPDLANQVNGTTEYERLRQALQVWAEGLPAQSLDDFSLSTPTGLYLIRDRDPQKLKQALAEFQPDLVKGQPSLTSLSEALDLAIDPLGRPLMKRSILFITPPLPVTNTASLPDLALRAQKIGVRVHVWQVGQSANISENAPEPLQQFAETTGGSYFQIISSGPLPAIEPFFQPFRHTYQIEYQSIVQKSGSHSLSVKVKEHSSNIQSDETHYNLTVEAPNPIFLTPPVEIRRSWTSTEEKQAEPVLTPNTVPLQILVEFSDNHPRPLKATRLFMDGVLVAENTTAPFDHFDWQIADQTTPARRLLRVEAVDILGMNGSSIEIPVDIQIAEPAKTSLFDRLSERGMIAISAIVVAGGALALILVFTNTQRRSRWKRQHANKKLEKDPVTQPVPVQPMPVRSKRTGFWKINNKVTRPVPLWPRAAAPAAPARLVALDESEHPITGGGISLTRQEITFGSDPKRATQVLNSPTVDGLHARLYLTPDGDFFIADQNSIAGTWINYAPVTSSGARLEHGDLIHVGKILFRFELTDPSLAPASEVKVINLDQTHDS